MPALGIPHCPKCRGTTGQHLITARERDGFKGSLRQWVEAKFSIAFRCSACRACYSFQDGFSSFLGYIPHSVAVNPPSSPSPTNPFDPQRHPGKQSGNGQ
jgi:hypothetical protein